MNGFGLNSWTTGDGADVLTDLRVCAQAGYQFIEWRDHKIENISQAAAISRRCRGWLLTRGCGC